MDTWKYYAITHHDHIVCNPTSLTKLDELIGLVDLPDEPEVVDIACGKGELLLRLAERSDPTGAGFHGVGVDISPYHVAELRDAAARRVPNADLSLLLLDGAAYDPGDRRFDLACCLGASWVFGGHRGTLRRLAAMTRAGGQILVGEPFWRCEPDAAHLEWSGLARDAFDSHAGNVRIGEEEGLVPLLALVSSGDEWDRYETLQWRAAARYARDHPDDPDLPELLERQRRARHEYLTWGRSTLGWSLYLFERPRSSA